MNRKTLRLIAVCLTALLVLAALPVFALAENGEGAYVVELGDGAAEESRDRLNVHETPEGGKDNVCGHLDEGTVVRYLTSENGWWYVEYWKGDEDIRRGYVDKDYLTPVKEVAKANSFTAVDDVHLHSQCEHIVKGECWKYHTGEMLRKGEKAVIVKQNGSWCWVESGNKAGWVPSIYLVERT